MRIHIIFDSIFFVNALSYSGTFCLPCFVRANAAVQVNSTIKQEISAEVEINSMIKQYNSESLSDFFAIMI